MIKAVIFDMDGVLIDSVATSLRVRKSMLAHHGVDLDHIPDPQGENHRASSLKMLLDTVRKHTGVTIDHDVFAREIIAQARKDLRVNGIGVDPGLVRFLDDLKRHEIRCAMASSGVRDGVNAKLEILGIADYFEVIVTGSDVKAHKPDPEAYTYAMARLGLTPAECLVFEDSATGTQAARAAGCTVVGFVKYNQPPMPLADTAMTAISWELDYATLAELGLHL